MKRSNRKNNQSSFTTFRCVVLSVSIGAFFVLIFLLVYYVYVAPMQKSLE